MGSARSAASNSTHGRPPPTACSARFIRIDTSFGSSSSLQTGALNQLYNVTAGPFPAKEQTIVNKAFVQFAGLTAGRAQSMFDFYADAYNYEALRGSNASPVLLAYTYTFGGPFTGSSATISAGRRRQPPRADRQRVELRQRSPAQGIPLAGFGWPAGGLVVGSRSDLRAGQQIPDIVGNFSVEQPWGSIQLSGAAHQLRTSAGSSDFEPYAGLQLRVCVSSGGNWQLTGEHAGPFDFHGPDSRASPTRRRSERLGLRGTGRVKVNAPWIAPGDAFYLQATYEQVLSVTSRAIHWPIRVASGRPP